MKKQTKPVPEGHTHNRSKQNTLPPVWADKLLKWFVAPHLLEYVQGDLHEHFYKRLNETSLLRARIEYLQGVMSCLTPFFAKRKENSTIESLYYNQPKPRFTDMLSNYFTVAFRNLKRHKAFTAINVIGLAVGLATCLLIVLFVMHELSYDRYHANADRLYRMIMPIRMGEKDLNYAYTSEPAGDALLRDCPSVESVTRLRYDGAMLVKSGQETFKEEHIAFVDSNFFSFFSVPLIKGHKASVLVEPRTVVITKTTARKYFGDTDPIGKTMTIGNQGVFRVTGVSEDTPLNTHFHYDIFGSIQSVNRGTKWLASGAYTYLLLRQGHSIQQVQAQTQGFLNKYIAPEVKEFLGIELPEFLQKGNRIGFGFQRITDIHLFSHLDDELEANGDIRYVYTFSAIALFILLLACINFMNLSTAGSAGRSKEVGIRKVLGSVRAQLVSQFLTESVILTFLALFLAFGLVVLLLPVFNDLTGKQFAYSAIFNLRMLAGVITACLLIGLLAGSYPAFVLASFKPITVLKGKIQAGLGNSWLRNTLVTGQFVVSIGMIIATIVANQQLRFMQNKKVGFDKDQVLVLHDTQVLDKKLNAFKAGLATMAPVLKVASAGFMPAGLSHQSQDGIIVKDGTRTSTHVVKSYYIDDNYLPTLGIGLLQGRNFSRAFPTDNLNILINEAAARAYGFKNAIGKQIYTVGDGSEESKKTYTIVGVVKDFHFENMHQRIAPLIMFYGEDNSQLAIRIRTNDIPALITNIQHRWKAETGNPFVYSFLNERFNTMYQAEQRIGRLFGIFAALAVLIACLGLFGLAAFTTHQRTKEIGVRKVLGASVTSIITLLLSNYIRLILIAMLIAAPIAGYTMNQWLQDFAYRTDTPWWVFVLAGVLATTIAILTVSYQAIKAALMNPVKSLKTE